MPSLYHFAYTHKIIVKPIASVQKLYTVPYNIFSDPNTSACRSLQTDQG